MTELQILGFVDAFGLPAALYFGTLVLFRRGLDGILSGLGECLRAWAVSRVNPKPEENDAEI